MGTEPKRARAVGSRSAVEPALPPPTRHAFVSAPNRAQTCALPPPPRPQTDVGVVMRACAGGQEEGGRAKRCARGGRDSRTGTAGRGGVGWPCFLRVAPTPPSPDTPISLSTRRCTHQTCSWCVGVGSGGDVCVVDTKTKKGGGECVEPSTRARARTPSTGCSLQEKKNAPAGAFLSCHSLTRSLSLSLSL